MIWRKADKRTRKKERKKISFTFYDIFASIKKLSESFCLIAFWNEEILEEWSGLEGIVGCDVPRTFLSDLNNVLERWKRYSLSCQTLTTKKKKRIWLKWFGLVWATTVESFDFRNGRARTCCFRLEWWKQIVSFYLFKDRVFIFLSIVEMIDDNVNDKSFPRFFPKV